MLCPCGSQKEYKECCKKYHEGTIAENALLLMKSRYSAYALNLTDYIIDTTHKDYHPKDEVKWRSEISFFSKNTLFEGVTILEFIDGDETAYVTFKAHLKQNNQNVSFIEKSLFKKYQNRWFYCRPSAS